MAKIKVFGVLEALTSDLGCWHCFGIRSLVCAGFVCCHCTGRWTVLDNTHSIDSDAFRYGCSTAATMALTSINHPYQANITSRFKRSQFWHSLVPPLILNQKQKGDRSYRVGMPILWNKPPTTLCGIESLDSCKNQLKTYHFKLHYRC